MEQPFYRQRLQARGLQVLVLPEEARAQLHRVIYEELCQGVIQASSRQLFRQIMAGLVADGAQAIVLGCTEIALLVDASDAQVPLFDTTALHAEAAARASLG
ncbi:L-aspartate/glutamate-specific racemase [Xanthomonas citri pv. punicae]|nr:L-aspartate/glutamate-specific racemase [Xanthomonas citri pv. punicae]UIS29092.1 L-aspartate/glutamate-specific racemase [Xanthomonas citri pv. punicae]